MSREATIKALLRQIRFSMEALALWSERAPDAQALASTEPFCVDTLSFCEWVQWVMIPRLEQMLSQGAALPENSDIASMAEEAFKLIPKDTSELLDLIRQLDEALNVRH